MTIRLIGVLYHIIPERWDFLFSALSQVLKADTNQRQSDRRQTAHTSIARLLNVSLIPLSFFTKLLKICFWEGMLQGEPPLPTPHRLAWTLYQGL